MRAWLAAIAVFQGLASDVTAQSGTPTPLPDYACDYLGVTKEPSARDAAEAECIRKAGVNIERAGNWLAVRLDNGQLKEFVGNWQACRDHDVGKCLDFRFVGDMPEAHTAIVEKGCYEFCIRKFAIHLADGATIVMESWPSPSPDRRHFVVVAASEAEPLQTPELQIFEIKDRRPVRKFSYEKISSYEYWSLQGWVGNDIVDLEVHVRGQNCESVVQVPMKLLRIKGQWQLQPEFPCK